MSLCDNAGQGDSEGEAIGGGQNSLGHSVVSGETWGVLLVVNLGALMENASRILGFTVPALQIRT